MRAATGLTYRALERKAGYSASALSAAASGDALPTLNVLLAYVQACGGHADVWEERWHALAATLSRTHPALVPDGEPRSGSPVPATATPSPGRPREELLAREDLTAQAEPSAERAGPGAHPGPDEPATPWPLDGLAPDGLAPLNGLAPLGGQDPRQIGVVVLAARLGAGTMGQVYLGRTPAGDAVAVKVIRAELADDATFRRRFRREARALAEIRSPYTAALAASDTEAARPWLAAAYVPALSLEEAVAAAGPLPPQAVGQLAGVISRALAATHAAGLVHRDLKPSNVLLTADSAQVIDFGIARAAEGSRLTAAGAHAGSAAFMAPEQAAGAPAGPAADVFALGSLLAYAMTGTPPFGEGRADAVAYRIVHQAPDLAAVNTLTSAAGDLDDLRDLIHACLDKDPAHRPVPDAIPGRYPSAASAPGPGWLPALLSARIAQRGAAALSSLAASAEPRPQRAGGGISPRRLRLGLGSLILAGVILIGYALLRNTGSTQAMTPPPSGAATSSSSASAATKTPGANTPGAKAPVATARAAAWAVATGGSVQSSPALAGGTVYIASNDRKVHALDAATGRVRWTQVTGSYADTSPAVADGTVYIGSWNDRVYALDSATGRVRWSYATGSAVDSSPAVAGGLVYVGSDDDRLYAFDAATGRVRWVRATGSDVQSSPVVAGGLVYVGSNGHKMYALDAVTGRVRWARGMGGEVQSSPAVAGGTVYVGSDDHKVYALDAVTGHLRWARGTGGEVQSSPAVAGGTVYVGSDDHKVYALSAVTGQVRWVRATGGYVASSPAVAGGTVYVGSDDHEVYALSAATGQVRWTHVTGGFVESSPAVAGGLVYVGSDDHRLYALDAATGKIR